MKYKIFFRADADEKIGYGHFIRSLALADMLKDDFECTFYTKNPSEYQINEVNKVCKLIELPDDGSRFESFLQELNGEEIVVLDNYFFSSEYQKAIKDKGCKLVCIDDMHDKHYYSDIVINHGVYNQDLFDVEPYTRLCLGNDWSLLRKPFLEATKVKAKHNFETLLESVVICFGGSDPYNITEKALTSLLKRSSVKVIDVIIGCANNCADSIKDSRVRFHRNISAAEVASLFSNCDLAILSSSSVCLEALACGATIAAGWYVDNQMEYYQNLVNSGKIYGLGDLRNYCFDSLDLSNMIPISNTNRTGNIAICYREVFHNLSESVYLRKVRPTDMDILFEWANEADVRANSFNSQEINYEDHVRWFNDCINRNDIFMYILINNGQMAGVIRLTCVDGTAIISYSIDKKQRGKGLGSTIIRLIDNEAQLLPSISSLEAHVKVENIPSISIFLSNGYSRSNEISRGGIGGGGGVIFTKSIT